MAHISRDHNGIQQKNWLTTTGSQQRKKLTTATGTRKDQAATTCCRERGAETAANQHREINIKQKKIYERDLETSAHHGRGGETDAHNRT
jgi:hypothetical protein